MLLGAPGLATGNKNATRGSWPYYSSFAICLISNFRGTTAGQSDDSLISFYACVIMQGCIL